MNLRLREKSQGHCHTSQVAEVRLGLRLMLLTWARRWKLCPSKHMKETRAVDLGRGDPGSMNLAFRLPEGLCGPKGHSGKLQGNAGEADFSLTSGRSFHPSWPEV